MMVEETMNIEESKPVDVAVDVDDETSVESTSDDGHSVVAHSGGETSGGRRFSRIFLLAILAIAVGLVVGLGLGLTIDETKKSHLRTPTMSEGEGSDSADYSDNDSEDVLMATVPPVPVEGGVEDNQEPPSGTKPPVDVTLVYPEDSMQWPELMGQPCDIAQDYLEVLDNGYFEVQVVYPGERVTKDYRFNRIRLYVDESCIVTSIPSIGR